MYNIIKRYCENENTNGLMLLDMPTGSGKTYSVVKYIYDAVQDSNIKRKFFFITTLKKNLPVDELKKHFEQSGNLVQFQEKFLMVDSNSESVIAGFTPNIKKLIPSDIKKSEEYKTLEQYVGLVTTLRQEKKSSLRGALIAAEDSLRKDAEPRFRRMLQDLLAKKFRTAEERIQAIKTDKDWQWVAELYPSVFMKDRQIIFMSVDKFLSLNSTIVEAPTMLYNSDMIDNAVIFIDEFDSTKETILKTIIQNGLRDKIDYVELFNEIYSVLHTHDFPTILTTPSKARREGRFKDQSLQDVINKTTKIADEIYDDFALQYSHRTENITDDNANNFLFQDHQYHSILNGNNAYITSVTNKNNRINSIKFSNIRPSDSDRNIQVMLGKLRGFISYFMTTVKILAINYQQCKSERRKFNEDEFTLEEAIRTVLAEFKLSNVYINYLTSQILVSTHKYRGDVQLVDFDLTFYEKGFRYYAFEDDYVHDTQSKIMMYSFQITPEKMLLRFCERAKVLGISATATLNSMVGNYDIKYLSEKLQDKYIDITPQERSRLKESFEDSVKGYDQVNIHVGFIGENEYNAQSWKQIADSDEFANMCYNYVNLHANDEKGTYNQERYFRIALAYKSFLLQSDIQSFLCVLTKHPRPNDKNLNYDILIKLFGDISKFYKMSFDKNSIVQLDGEEYDSKKDDIINRLGKGEKLFVISVYQTIGAGQNLQYPIPAKMEKDLVKINERPISGHKDFDAIYLEKPTNLITVLENNISEEDFIKYIFYVEMLQEKPEISVRDASAHIKKAFKTFSTSRRNDTIVSKINDCKSVIYLSTRIIIQAIGRICRTNMKSKNIYIYADSRIANRIDLEVCKGREFNREFVALMDTIKETVSQPVDNRTEELKNKGQLQSIRANKYINSMILEKWTENRISCWKDLRDMVLKHPTLTREEFDNKGIAYNFYVEMPATNNRIFYKEEEDFNNVQVFFQKEDGVKEVSEVASKLDALMKIDFLRKHFENHNWATYFHENSYVMCPPLFNNIYRGALGEVVGKALFYKYANVTLKEIEENELFEKFDYIVPGTSIYVDFKNWHENTYKDSDKEIIHISKKAKDCGCKCVIIANILAEQEWSIREQEIDGIRIVIVPALLSNSQNPAIVLAAWDKIRECIRDYGN